MSDEKVLKDYFCMSDDTIKDWKEAKDKHLTVQEFALKVQTEEIPNEVLVFKGVTAHEFKAKWDEYLTRFNGDTKKTWAEIAVLFDFEYIETRVL